MKKITLVAALLASAIISGPASAATLFYSFTPSITGMDSFTFSIDSNPVPTSNFNTSFYAAIQNFTRNGLAEPGATSIEFYTSDNGGGLVGNGFNLFGPQLFSGPTFAPTLLMGNFTLFISGAQGSLNVTDTVAGAVPEPATWAMMLVGFGGIGFAMRRKSKVTTRVAFA